MESYHHAWLKAHPTRSMEWLQERLKDGFAIHHLDGNHDNDDPSNLVLIDGVDHLMLHSGYRPTKELQGLVQERNNRVKRETIGKAAYESALTGKDLETISKELGRSLATVRKWIKAYCDEGGFEVPTPKSAQVVMPASKPAAQRTFESRSGVKFRVMANGVRIRLT